MASASFTRDEAILALDLLYIFKKRKKKLSAETKDMVELSALLNRLPIHSPDNRRAGFRTNTGIAKQLHRFQRTLVTGVNNNNIGISFFDINLEYDDKRDELHEIAQAIRRNEPYYQAQYGCNSEDVGFPEGILLGHLHRAIEVRDGARVKLSDHCMICKIKPELYYQSCGTLLQPHLTVAPVEMDGGKKYGVRSFITVCPTCHAALHRIRPWMSKGESDKILR